MILNHFRINAKAETMLHAFKGLNPSYDPEDMGNTVLKYFMISFIVVHVVTNLYSKIKMNRTH